MMSLTVENTSIGSTVKRTRTACGGNRGEK